MQIFVAQINPTIGALDENTRTIIKTIKQAKQEQSRLVVFPEMAICGYIPQDLVFDKEFVKNIERALQSIVEASFGISVIVGLIRKNKNGSGKPLRNSAAIIQDGKLVGFQDKSLLPTYDVFDERRYFEPAEEIGVWTLEGKKVAVTICEDMWCGQSEEHLYPKDPLDALKSKAVDIHINISASPYSYGKIERRKSIAIEVAKRFSTPFLLVNQVGGQDGLIFDGSSLFVTADGTVSFEAPAFSSYTGPVIERKERKKPYGEEVFLGLSFGLRDYFIKQGFKKACVGLSGGIDSSVALAIMVEALGKENVLGVLLPSHYTSNESNEDAYALAKNLDVKTKELSIVPAFYSLVETLKASKEPSVVTENLQSRIRGILLMAITNENGSLLINTGNKSELACGYTTLYGDSCGAVAVLGDLLKWQVYEVGRWVNREREIIPERVFLKAPSAELKFGQKDSDSLPEYPVLDRIVEAYIVFCKSAHEISQEFGFDQALVEAIIRRIHQNEYKRRQVPFALRVSEKAFSVGRFIPIVHCF
jgi:NAD+ synthase (glutamine-hydrolysing)